MTMAIILTKPQWAEFQDGYLICTTSGELRCLLITGNYGFQL